jgi:hypothetical protein
VADEPDCVARGFSEGLGIGGLHHTGRATIAAA